MTTIVWDGKTLAADKQGSGESIMKVTKIFRIEEGKYKGSLVGFAGTFHAAMAFLWYLKKHADDESKYPSVQGNDDKNVHVILITPKGEIYKWESGSFPFLVENDKMSIGSGCMYAIGALECGKNSVEALQIAMKHDRNSGMGIDTLTLVRRKNAAVNRKK